MANSASPAAGCLVAGALLASTACATTTAESRLRENMYWDAAKICESRYHTIHLDRIDTEGNATAHADAETRSELQAFNTCYRNEMRKSMEKLEKAGQPVPEGLNLQPGLELD